MKRIIVCVLSFLMAIPSFSQTLVKEAETNVKQVRKMYGIHGENGTFCLNYHKNGLDHYKVYDKDFNQINAFITTGISDGNDIYPRVQVWEEGFTFFYEKRDIGQVSVLFIPTTREGHHHQNYQFQFLQKRYLGLIADKGVYYALSLDNVKDIINVHHLANNGTKEVKKFDLKTVINYKIDISHLQTGVFSSGEIPNFADAGSDVKFYLLDDTKILMTYNGGVNEGMTRTFVLDWETGKIEKGKTIGTLENKAESNSFYLDGKFYQYKSNKDVFSLLIQDFNEEQPEQVFTYKKGDKMEIFQNHRLYRFTDFDKEDAYQIIPDHNILLRSLHRPRIAKTITAEKQEDGSVYLKIGNSNIQGVTPYGVQWYFGTLARPELGRSGSYITSFLSADQSEFLNRIPLKEVKINQRKYAKVWKEKEMVKELSKENKDRGEAFIKEKEAEIGREIKSHIIVPYGKRQLLVSYLNPKTKKIMFYLMDRK